MPALRRVVSCLILIAASLSLCLIGACQQQPDPAALEVQQTVENLAQDIELLGTLNRLDLQPAQLSPLYAVAVQAQQAKAKLQPPRQAALAQLAPLLRDKRTLLMQDKDVPEQLDTQIRRAYTQIEVLDDQIAQAQAALAPEARRVLTADQIAIVIGADEARAQAQELLEWIRDLPEGDFAEEAGANARELADPEAKLTAQDIMKVFTEARKLSASAYQAKKDQYVAKLAPLYAPTAEAADGAIAQFLSSPRLCAILQERGAK